MNCWGISLLQQNAKAHARMVADLAGKTPLKYAKTKIQIFEQSKIRTAESLQAISSALVGRSSSPGDNVIFSARVWIALAFGCLSTSFHCESLWYLWWSESEASIAPQSMANRLAESALVAMKIATSVRTQQCFLVLTPHFAVKCRGGQRPQIYPNFAYVCVSTHIGHVRNHMTCTMTWSFSTSDLLILLLCRTLMPAPSARTASFWTRIFGVRQIVPLATTRQVSVIFSETALQFHLNIKMIPNAWSTKTSHGDSRGLIQHSSSVIIIIRSSASGEQWRDWEHLWEMPGTLPKLSRQSDAGSSACRLSKPFKTTNGPNGLCTEPSNSASWGHGPPPTRDPIKDLYALRPGRIWRGQPSLGDSTHVVIILDRSQYDRHDTRSKFRIV